MLVVYACYHGRLRVDFRCFCFIYDSHLLLMRALVFRRMTKGDRLAHHHQIQLHHLGMAALASLAAYLPEAMLHVGYAILTLSLRELQLTFYSLS